MDCHPLKPHLAPLLFLLAATSAAASAAAQTHPTVTKWDQVLSQPPSWYASQEAITIGDNVLLWQRDIGGWNKISNMAIVTDSQRADALAQKATGVCTLDNGATHQQLRYLAALYTATKETRFKEAFDRGLAYLLKSQYPTGGWPQYFPLRGGYHDHITFNDGAMVGALNLLREVANHQGNFAFVTEDQQTAAKQSIQKAIDVILKSQITFEGKRTGWCAQHHSATLAPAKARSYELPSISGSDTVTITTFLMTIDNPSPAIIEAITSAATWLETSKITGKRLTKTDNDRILIDDPTAPPLWARFYDLTSNRPLFCNRDGIPKSDYMTLERSRRTAYLWLGTWAQPLLEQKLPAWKARLPKT